MCKLISVLLLAFLASGCSTVERRIYFSPQTDQKLTSGPKAPSCGMYNFGGLPDSYIFPADINLLEVTAPQSFEPYLFGPWLVSIIPVFPIPWIADFLLFHGETEVQISISKSASTEIPTRAFSISKVGDVASVIKPSSALQVDRFNDVWYKLTFDVDYRNINTFVFHIQSDVKGLENIDIPFIKTSRWSWTQWSPNC